MKPISKSNQSSLLGVLTTIIMAVAVIDFNTFDFNKSADLWKLLLIIVPAFGGAVSSINTKAQRGKRASLLASVLGVLTSACTAWAVIDFSTFDFSNKNNWVKLVVLALPAIGGFLSSVNGNDTKTA